MTETGVLVGFDGKALHWHLPPGRTTGSLPDSRDLWSLIWEDRGRIVGFAHTHPGYGRPGPSYEDVTTFAAVEAALGRRLLWWIVSGDEVVVVRYRGPERLMYEVEADDVGHPWLGRLRDFSGFGDAGLPIQAR